MSPAALMPCAATKSSSLTSAGCAGRLEMTHPSGRFHRCTDLCPRVTLAGSASSVSVRFRFHTCRPVYRGFSRIVVTVPSDLTRQAGSILTMNPRGPTVEPGPLHSLLDRSANARGRVWDGTADGPVLPPSARR